MSANENLVAATVRLEPAVIGALANKAKDKGQELADYMADVLTDDVLNDGNIDPAISKRLTAERDVKEWALEKAGEFNDEGFDRHVTRRVFKAIQDHKLNLYVCAIGGGSPFARGNHIKARINRSLGAAIKTAVRATPAKNSDGSPVKKQVSGELIFSYTELEPQ